MTTTTNDPIGPDANAFGKLVQAYRRQRGWKQKELAERWGHTREYVSQIELGKRKLEKQEQVTRLADLLEIPAYKLEAAGKTVLRPVSSHDPAGRVDDVLLEAILLPAETSVKLSWLMWHGNETLLYDIEASLERLIPQLEDAVSMYHGEFTPRVFRMLAYAYEMLGKFAVDRIETQRAYAQFQHMYDLAEELGDTDLLVQAIMHQADMFRRRGWQQHAYNRMEAARHLLPGASLYLQGVWHKIMARNHYVYGNKTGFVQEIGQAKEIALQTPETIDTANNEFNLVECLQEEGQGYTMLWQPAKALEIYQRTDTMRAFRPKRDLGSYTIIKAQAHCGSGDLGRGVELAEQGLALAESYHSSRHVKRLQIMSNRLGVTTIGRDKRMKSLGQHIQASLDSLKGL